MFHCVPFSFFFGWFILCLVYRAVLITLLDYADCPLRATSPLYPPKKKLVQGVKKTNKQKSKQLILARHPTCMVRASYMAMAICFQRGMVNNVGIHFYFSAFLFLFFSSMSMFV